MFKRIVMIVTAAALASCATKTSVPIRPAPVLPENKASSYEAAKELRQPLNDADRAATVIGERNKSLEKQVDALKEKAANANESAKIAWDELLRLKKANAGATVAEVESLTDTVASLAFDNASLSEQLVKAHNDISSLGVPIDALKNALSKSMERASASERIALEKDAESKAWEKTAKNEIAFSGDVVKASAAISGERDTAVAKNGKLEGKLTVCYWIIFGTALTVIGLIVLAVFLNSARKTINPLS